MAEALMPFLARWANGRYHSGPLDVDQYLRMLLPMLPFDLVDLLNESSNDAIFGGRGPWKF
jgi:hypothetical protein